MMLASAAGPSSASPRERVAVQRAIAATFLGGFRLVALSAAGLGLASAAITALTIDAQPEARSSDDPARTPPIDLRKRGRAYRSRDGDPERQVRKLAVRDLTTTVLTLTLTGLVADSSLAGGSNPGWLRRTASVGAMSAGAAAGAWLLGYSLALVLALCALVSAGCATAAFVGMAPDGRAG